MPWQEGAGGSARALNDPLWQKTVKDDYLRKRIIEGWTERLMPSFVNSATPSLNKVQVDSLIQYIRQFVNVSEQ